MLNQTITKLGLGAILLLAVIIGFIGCGGGGSSGGSSGTAADQPPVLTSPGNKTVNENQPISFTLLASDQDGQTISYSMSGTTTGAALITTTGLFSWTPGCTQADVYTVVFTATANALSDSKTITITVNNVNQAPILDAIGNQATNEGLLLTFVITGTDPDSDTLAFSATGLPAGATFVTSTRTFSWTPPYDGAGVYNNVIFTVTDNGAGNLTDSEAITITVNAVNDSPSFTKGSDQTISEDAGAQSVTNWATGISPGPSDESGQIINFIVSNDNNSLFSAQPAVAANGTLAYTAEANTFGSAIVSIQIHDDGGTANGGIDTSTALTFTITPYPSY